MLNCQCYNELSLSEYGNVVKTERSLQHLDTRYYGNHGSLMTGDLDAYKKIDVIS